MATYRDLHQGHTMESTTTCEVPHLISMETVAQVDKNFATVKGLRMASEETGRLDRLDEDTMGRLDLAMAPRVVDLVQIGILQIVNRDHLLIKDRVSSSGMPSVLR